MRANLGIDFAKDRKLPGWFAICAAALGVLILLLALTHWHGVSQARDAALKAVADPAEPALIAQGTKTSQKTFTEDPKRIAAVNTAIAALNVPWAGTLKRIEESRPGEVALLRLEPRVQDRRIRVVAQANQADPLFEFVSALAQDKAFPSVTPVRQERVGDDGKSGVKLSFDVEWGL
jgi:hypothetical protein